MQICLNTIAGRPTLTGVSLAVAIAFGAGGCAASGQPKGAAMSPQARADANPAPTDAFAKLGYRLDWRGFPTMLPGERVRTLEILGDVIALQESAGVVSVLETRSGQTKWSDQVAGRLTKFVGINRDDSVASRVIVSSESEVYFYDLATGNLKDKQHLAQVVNTKPVRVGDILVYGCANGQILGHYAVNGFRAWGSGLTGSIETDPVLTSSGRVALCSTTGELVVMDGLTGLSQGRAKMFSGPGAEIASSDSALFIASSDHSLYAFSSEGLIPLWRKRTDAPLKHKPVFNDGKLYCDMGAAGMTCYEAGPGKELWSNPSVHGEIVALRGKRLIAWNGSEAVTLDPTKGSIIDTVKLDNISILKPDAFTDGHMYAVSPNGIVSKLSPK